MPVNPPSHPNPYDFVPLEGQPSYVEYCPDHSRAVGLYGTISFTLHILTPLCVQHSPSARDLTTYPFAHLGGRPILPATSLKGMLRSVHEVVTNSTMGLLSTRDAFYLDRIPKVYRPDEADRKLTPSEALFGMVGGEGDREPNTVGYAGRVFLADIPFRAELLIRQPVSRPQGGQPKPAHESFYFERGPRSPILGRKFYYHQREGGVARVRDIYRLPRNQGGRGMPEITVEALPAGTRLRGSLRFTGLERSELAALVYSLILEDGLAHKLGYGKPLGLGSLQISIDSLSLEPGGADDPRARFMSFDPPAEPVILDSAEVKRLRDEAKAAWLARPRGQASYEAFTTIAAWPGVTDYLYPDFGFFRGERGRPDREKTTLWEYQERATPHPTRGAAPATGSTKPQLVEPPPEEATPPAAPVELVGMLAYDERRKYIVRVGAEVYDVFTGGPTAKLIKRLMRQLDQGATFKVRFRLDPNLARPAYDLELVPEDEQ